MINVTNQKLMLVETNEVLGERFLFNFKEGSLTKCEYCLDIPYDFLSEALIKEIKKNNWELSEKDKPMYGRYDKKGVFKANLEPAFAIEVDSATVLTKCIKQMKIRELQYIAFIETAKENFDEVISKFKRLCGRYNITVNNSEIEEDINSLSFNIRFLGGYSAWSGSEDICDSDKLNQKVYKKLDTIIEDLENETGYKIEYCTSEKAWTYFNIVVNLER